MFSPFTHPVDFARFCRTVSHFNTIPPLFTGAGNIFVHAHVSEI